MAYTDRFPIVKNFLETKLTADCDAGETTLYLEKVDGLPRILAGRDYVPLVLRDAGTVREIVYVDSVDNTAGTVTVRRGQEGTTPAAWATGTYAYCTVTSDSFQRMRVNGFAPLVTDEGRPSISRTSATTVNIAGDFTAQLEVGMAVRVLSGDTVVEPTDAELGAIHITAVSFSAGVTSVSFQNVSLPTKVDGLDLGLSVASAPLYHPDTIVADEDTLTQTQNVLSVSQKFKDDLKAEQAQKDAAQDAAISAKVASVNGLTPDADGNVDVGGMPLGTVFPYTGKDVPAGTLRADGSTYTNMRNSFPEFYNWVVASGLTVALASYALVEGSCGFYGLDESTGTVRMPTLAAGVFGTTAAGQYGMAVEAGLPNITGHLGHLTSHSTNGVSNSATSALYWTTTSNEGAKSIGSTLGKGFDPGIDASRSSAIYGKSDTVTPSHVKYPWVIVVYNAAVSASVAQAQEFIGLLDGKADKAQVEEGLAAVVRPGFVMPFAANSTPSGYLLCNGAAVSRTTYAALFSVIGTIYGTGDGSTTFNLPNLTDKFIQGSGTAGNVKAAGLPNITGHFDTSPCNGASSSATGALYWESGKAGTRDGGNGMGFNASRSNSIYGASTTVQPPALTMRYYIKY